MAKITENRLRLLVVRGRVTGWKAVVWKNLQKGPWGDRLFSLTTVGVDTRIYTADKIT